MTDPSILFERSGVVAIVKPAGLPTQAPPGIASAESWLRGRLPAGAYAGIPHRLDRAVSGVLLLAVTPRAARHLSRQFERRLVEKHYVAIVAVGRDAEGMLPSRGTGCVWSDAIAKLPDRARAAIVPADDPAGRTAETVVALAGMLPPRDAGSGARAAVLRLSPRTGRMHQLRLQAASRGLPILGDDLYGGGDFGDRVRDPRERPVALHARSISYRDPDLGEAVEMVAPFPSFWPEEAVRLAGG